MEAWFDLSPLRWFIFTFVVVIHTKSSRHGHFWPWPVIFVAAAAAAHACVSLLLDLIYLCSLNFGDLVSSLIS